MDNRVKLILFIVGVLLIFTVLFALFSGDGRPKVAQSNPVANNMNFAEQVDENTIHFFTGSAFASYDLGKHTTSPITPQYSLPSTITEIRLSKRGALINATGYSQVDQLYPELVRKALNPNAYYWWYLDYSNGLFSLLGNPTEGADVRDAFWQNDDSFTFSENLQSKGQLFVYSTDLTKPETTELQAFPDDGTLLVGASPGVYFYLDKDFTLFLKKPNEEPKKLAGDVYALLDSGRDGSALAIQVESKSVDPELPFGNLILYDNASGKVKRLSDSFGGTAAWRPDNNTWVAIGTDSRGRSLGFTNQTGVIADFAISDVDSEAETPRFTALGLSPNILYLADGHGSLRFVGNNIPTDLPVAQDNAKLSAGIYEPEFSIVYDSYTGLYSIYIIQNPYETNRQKVVTYITSQGLDFNQLFTKWFAYDGVDTGFYLPPGIEPVEQPIPINPGVEAGE